MCLFLRRILVRLNEDHVVLLVPQLLLLLLTHAVERHAPPFLDEDAVDLSGALVDDLDPAGLQRAVADERVAEREVEEFVLAGLVELVGDGWHKSGVVLQRRTKEGPKMTI
jgi:hypothetical protein